MFCAYHGEDHIDGRKFSDEHILPYSLGGHDGFVIRICKSANDIAGSAIDAKIINTLYMSLERISMNILSKDGTQPQWDFNGTAKLGNEEPRRVRYTISTQEPVMRVLPLAPSLALDAETEIYNINCDRADRDTIVENIRKKLSRKYGQEMIAQPLKETVHSFENVEITVAGKIEINDWYRAYAKIALGTAHFILGEQYSRSPGARLLRERLWSTENVSTPVLPHIWPLPLDASRQQLIDSLSFRDWHTIAITRFGCVVIILFGKYYGLIPLTNNPNDPLFDNDGTVCLLDPRNRNFFRYSFGKFLTMKQTHS